MLSRVFGVSLIIICTGKHRGFAFLEFEDPDDATAAADNFNQTEFFGKVIQVNLARPAGSAGRAGSHLTPSVYFQFFTLCVSSVFVLCVCVVWEPENALEDNADGAPADAAPAASS